MKHISLLFLLFITTTAIVFISGCAKEAPQKLVPLVDEATYSEVDFTDVKIDSAFISSFLANTNVNDSTKRQVASFYHRRDYQFGWFTKTGMTYPVDIFYDQLHEYINDFKDSTLVDPALDSLVQLARNDERAFLKNKENAPRLDLLLTTNYFKYADRAYGGLNKSPVDLEWYIPRKKKNYEMLLDSLVIRNKTDEIKEPENIYYTRLIKELRKYRQIEKEGGFPLIDAGKELKAGDTSGIIVKIKDYLRLTGDYAENDTDSVFTDNLSKSIKIFQSRMGLSPNGKLGSSTVEVMNVPISRRIRQIMINLERLRWMTDRPVDDRILINIPEFALHYYRKDSLIWNTNVVVGKEITKTVIFSGNMSNIVLNPYWNVPQSIMKKEIIPAMQKNPNYLTKNNMEIVSTSPLSVRQKPWKNNSLGKLKFLFPNNYSIYLHDTPAKYLFSQNKRAYSHGCVRVENPVKLAKLLLTDQPQWLNKVDAILNTDKETWIPVKPPMPVYIVYFTAWVDQAGNLNFRNDVYGHDKKLGEEIFGKG